MIIVRVIQRVKNLPCKKNVRTNINLTGSASYNCKENANEISKASENIGCRAELAKSFRNCCRKYLANLHLTPLQCTSGVNVVRIGPSN